MMSASPKREHVSVSGLRRRSVVVPTDVLLVSDYGPSFCTYSPSCLEEVFSETPGFRHYVFSETRYSPGPIGISQACAFHSGFPQPFHVARRRRAEQPLVLAGELRDVAVAHAVASARGVEVLAEHEAAGLLQPHPLLELQGAHRCDRLEVVVEARDAHPDLPGYVLDPERPVEVFAEPLKGPDDAVAVATQGRDMMEPTALFSPEEPVDDLPNDQRPEEAGLLGGRVQNPDETCHGVQQARGQRAHV